MPILNRQDPGRWGAIAFIWVTLRAFIQDSYQGLLASWVFYTQLPIPVAATLPFERAAAWVPVVGIGIGGGLALLDQGFSALQTPMALRSAVLVLLGVWVTGGLHLDGAMDTADGLAVSPERRLAVMADSLTGAFGVMAAIAILLLKVTALASISKHRGWVLVLMFGWSRWGQQGAIALYPYLKASGKGAMHQRAIRSIWDTIPGLLLLLGIAALPLHHGLGDGWQNLALVALALSGGAIALGLAMWFGQRLGGHTGDSYGAVVEWSEALGLVLWAMVSSAL